MSSSEKYPSREDGKTAKLSDSTFLVFGSEVSIEKQGRQQPNTEVKKKKFCVYKSCKRVG